VGGNRIGRAAVAGEEGRAALLSILTGLDAATGRVVPGQS
jgi:hypothetical protein